MPPPPPAPADFTHTLYLVRHGARYDYASPARWQSLSSALPAVVPTDPPLSALGLEQARLTAKHLHALLRADLAKRPAARLSLRSSLYYRVLQTALPLAHLLQSSPLQSSVAGAKAGGVLQLEPGLCEFGHVYNTIPGAAERAQILPEVDLGYEPLLRGSELDWCGGKVREESADYLRRSLSFAARYEAALPSADAIDVFYSHAASSSVLAALLRLPSLEDIGLFAPCGVFKLARASRGGELGPWELLLHGEDNEHSLSPLPPHLSASASTRPWGFAGGGKGRDYGGLWADARARNAAGRIYHLVAAAEWSCAGRGGGYRPGSLGAEGFVHCSGSAGEALAVANMFYKGQAGDFLLLRIDVHHLPSGVEVKWEEAGGGTYPHVYGEFGRDAVEAELEMRRDAEGAFVGVVE
jgi:uncharacterized protein (DUF952 family)/broad specificity phosphatase PhoE